MGLIAYAYPAGRGDLERASDLFRRFREQPTPQLARAARTGVRLALSPNDRLQAMYHPWTSYVIVPLFALANAGVPITGEALRRAFTSPITIGILVGYLVGKPIGIAGPHRRGEPLEPGTGPPAGGLGFGARRRNRRQHRLHRLGPDRRHRAPR